MIFVCIVNIVTFYDLSSFSNMMVRNGVHVDRDDDDWVAMVKKLKVKGIRLLVFDFDFTIVDIHTGGRWKGTVEKLCEHVRPVFKSFISSAHSNGLQIAIATFSPQVKLVRDVMQCAFPGIASDVIIRGNDDSWDRKRYKRKGKQAHINSIVEKLLSKEKKFPGFKVDQKHFHS